MAPRAPRSSAGCSSRRPRPCTTSKTPSRPATASAARVTSEGDDASIGLELPVLEWRPETWYSGSFGSSFSTELGLSLDTGRATASGGLFLRVGFDAKRYVASPLSHDCITSARQCSRVSPMLRRAASRLDMSFPEAWPVAERHGEKPLYAPRPPV